MTNKATEYSGLILLFAILSLAAWACNPFLNEEGSEGQPCLGSGVCKDGLMCVADVCMTPPDGGDADGADGSDGGDGDQGDGDLDPCQAPDLDCSEANLAGQGTDGDEDGWGSCCDCDDTNPEVNPGLAEVPYNGLDDDCHPTTRDDDLDQDNYLVSDGSDCDDTNPDIHPNAPEVCNGLDDNCDQATDEDMIDQPCPLNQGVCAGVLRTCQGQAGWTECVYPAEHNLDPETVCDLLDNDCDGQTDEDGQLVLEPESGALAEDGIDNNCNGLIDEVGGVMVPIPMPLHEGKWIDAFEMTVFENANCIGPRYGESSDDYPVNWPADGTGILDLYACSMPNVIPSGYLSWHRASLACQAQGKRLCDRHEFRDACAGTAALSFPYAAVFVPGICNDAWGGSGTPEPSGSNIQCTASGQTFDMSGNLSEWLLDESYIQPGNYLTGGNGYACQFCEYGEYCWVCQEENDNHYQWVKVLSMCTVGDVFGSHDNLRSFSPAQALPYLGSRCCYEPNP